MNFLSWLVLILIIVGAAFAIRYIAKQRKEHRCCGSCEGCPYDCKDRQ
ncbi:MAG: FeoB-associated Cys-rich membrane protein [Clostridia bacterium]|nr:FeoB-associated Cys-rich membrane protein [Clostridia bacterium]